MIQEKYEEIVKTAFRRLSNEYPEEMIPVLGGGWNKPYVVPSASRHLSCSFEISLVDRFDSWKTDWDKIEFLAPKWGSVCAFVIRNPEAPITIDMAARMLESWCESFSGIKPE
jgi:hypothetical protein